MPNLPWLLLIIVQCLLFAEQRAEELELHVEPQCSDIQRHEIESHLSTKTPYRVVANSDEAPPQYPGCQAKRIWSVIRHGTRNPSKEVIGDAKDDLIQLKQRILTNQKTRLCPEELARLRFWYFNVSATEEKYLVAEGEDELVELAERMQKRFPELLPEEYNPELYYFKYTATQRTLLSARSFATGLFGRQRLGEIVYPEALHRDPILRVNM